MSLPYLKPKDKSVAGIIMKTRQPDEKAPEMPENDESAAIEACAQELVRAIHSRDAKAVAMALKDAFDILDGMPHEEGEHTEPHSYDASKE